MKKNQILLGAAGLLALGLTACSNEMPVNAPQTTEAEETRFISIQLSAPKDQLGTRAELGSEGFANGTTQESYVYCLDFLYYDINGNPTGSPAHIGEDDLKKLTYTENPTGNNVTRLVTTVVPVQLNQGDNIPSQVICIVNGNSDVVNQIATKSLNSEDGNGFRDITQMEFSRGGNFLMTNSVYYGQDVLTGKSEQRLCATPINTNTQLFATRKAAEDAITAASAEGASQAALVDIYVERVAAKVSLTLNAANIAAYTLTNGDAVAEGDPATVSIKFTPEYWLMNAVDKETYLTKRYGVDEGTVTAPNINMSPDYNTINTALSNAGFTGWNAENYHRSYWGTSPSYFKNSFPLVSDQVFDPVPNDEGVETVYDPYKDTKYPVNYFSYQSILNNINRTDLSAVRKQWVAAETGGNFTNSVIYTRETTTPKVTINNDGENGNPAAAVGSAVIVGRYYVNGATTPRNFYIDSNDGENGTYYGSESSARNTLIDRQTVLFIDDQGQDALDIDNLDETTEGALNSFRVKHPEASVRALFANPDIAGRLVALQLINVPTEVPLYYFNNATGVYDRVTTDNIKQVNRQLVSAGYMDMYYQGLGFYSIPIRHLNFNNGTPADEENNTPAVAGSYDRTKNTYNWKTMKVGELGIVRNHAYAIEVSSIKGLASGLRSVNQPIVPAKEQLNQYMAVRLNILAWNVVNSWSVDL